MPHQKAYCLTSAEDRVIWSSLLKGRILSLLLRSKPLEKLELELSLTEFCPKLQMHDQNKDKDLKQPKSIVIMPLPTKVDPNFSKTPLEEDELLYLRNLAQIGIGHDD